MTQYMSEKIKMIEEYIIKLETACKADDDSEIAVLEDEIIGVYNSEIPDLEVNIDGCYTYEGIDYKKDARILMAKLTNYKHNLRTGIAKGLGNIDKSLTVNQVVKQEQKTEIRITLEQVSKSINQIPKVELSDDDKAFLCGNIALLEIAEGKENKWDKAKDILKWIADKGVDVGITVLPYILQNLDLL